VEKPTINFANRPSLRRPAILLVVLLALVAYGSRHQTPAPPSRHQDALAAVVNGIPVPMRTYDWQLAVATRAYAGPYAPPNSPTGKTIARLLRDDAVQEAIAETVISSVAARHRVTVSDTEVAQEVARLTRAVGGSVGLTHQLRTAGMTMADLSRVARHTVLRDRVATVLGDPAWLDHLVGHAHIIYYVGDGAASADAVPAIMLGHPAPPFVAVDLSGRAVSLADLRGKAVVLDFWTTGCADCQGELPLLLALARAHPHLVVVALDRQEDAGTIRRYLTSHQLGGLTVWRDLIGQAAINYTVASLPDSFSIDDHGILRAYNFGPLADAASLDSLASYAEAGTNDTQH
jgi:thiol-disulfide isomerase/thioredoxin